MPDYWAADGNAANTSAQSGDQWRVNFAPDEVGTWNFVASFRAGTDLALDASAAAGSPSHFDGAGGSFVIGPTDKTGRDHRGKGRLQYVGKHHLRFTETGEYFLKMGADSPENLLNYVDLTTSLRAPPTSRPGLCTLTITIQPTHPPTVGRAARAPTCWARSNIFRTRA